MVPLPRKLLTGYRAIAVRVAPNIHIHEALFVDKAIIMILENRGKVINEAIMVVNTICKSVVCITF